MASLLFVLALMGAELHWREPTGDTLAGKTQFRFDTDLAKEELIGFELLINGRSAGYLDAPPFVFNIDLSKYAEGQITIKAVLRRFGQDPLTRTRTFTNLAHAFSEEVQLVQVPLLVDEIDVTAGQSLGPEAFHLFEDGKRQSVQYVLNHEEPLQLVILLDLSGSMINRVNKVRRGIYRLLDFLQPQDEVKIVGFNHLVFELTSFSTDKKALKKDLLMLRPEGGTNLYGAVWSGARMLGRANKRRAVFVFTDGHQDLEGVEVPILRKDLDEAIDTARNLGIPVYIMGVGREVQIREINRIAALTGGQSFLIRHLRDLDSILASLGKKLRFQYLLFYNSSAPKNRWYSIEIRLPSRPEALLRYPQSIFLK